MVSCIPPSIPSEMARLKLSVATSPATRRVRQVPVLNLKGVQVQQGDCPVGVVAVEAFDGDAVALGLIGVVPVAVYHQFGANRLDHPGQQAPHLRGCPFVGFGYRQSLQPVAQRWVVVAQQHVGRPLVDRPLSV